MSNPCAEPGGGTVHRGHKATKKTVTHDEGDAMVTYTIWKCLCGKHKLEVFKSAQEKSKKDL